MQYLPTLNRCVLSRFCLVWLFETLWTAACQAPLSMGFSRQEHWSGLLCPPSGRLPEPGIEPASRILLHWQEDSLPWGTWDQVERSHFKLICCRHRFASVELICLIISSLQCKESCLWNVVGTADAWTILIPIWQKTLGLGLPWWHSG